MTFGGILSNGKTVSVDFKHRQLLVDGEDVQNLGLVGIGFIKSRIDSEGQERFSFTETGANVALHGGLFLCLSEEQQTLLLCLFDQIHKGESHD